MSTNSFVQIQEFPGSFRTVRYDQFVLQLLKADTKDMMLLHCGLGVCGEAGELADAIKRHVIYGKPLDRANVIEELGDLRFYMEAVCNILGISDQEVLQANADKLSKRYKDLTYSGEAAIARADKEGDAS